MDAIGALENFVSLCNKVDVVGITVDDKLQSCINYVNENAMDSDGSDALCLNLLEYEKSLYAKHGIWEEPPTDTEALKEWFTLTRNFILRAIENDWM